MKYFLLIFMLFSWTLTMSQKIKFIEERKIDTLSVWMNISPEIDSIFKSELNAVFQNVIKEFNTTQSNYYVKIDSMNNGDFINLSLGRISYSKNKHSIMGIGASALLVGGHVLMIATQGYTFPIWPILIPATQGQLTLSYSAELFDNRSKSTKNIESSGYFRKIEKQQDGFKKRFRKRLSKILEKIEKENLP